MKLRTKSPATTTNTNESATCDVTIQRPGRECERDSGASACVPFMAEARDTRVERKAGRTPNSNPVSTATLAVKARMRMSIVNWRKTGLRVVEIRRTRRVHPHRARRTPSAAPESESRTHSVRSWRISREREAPIASRTAISFRRAAARASIRLATFAQAMSNTSPTTAMSIQRGRE